VITKLNDLINHDSSFKKISNKKIAMVAIFIALGLILSYINPFAYFPIFGTKINPFAHIVNSITGVLIGLTFSCITALGIAILRFSFTIGTIHAFHGGISGAFVVGLVALLLKNKKPNYRNYAALFEPIGTIFIGGTIAYIIAPLGSIIEGLSFYWILFAMSSIPGSIIGFIILGILKTSGITWENFEQ